MEQRVLIITHSKDNDGHFSGAICQYFEEKIRGIKAENISYLRWSYGDKNPDITELEKFDRIYILDLTLDFSVMDYLAREYKGSIIWIDHHKANYEKLPEYIHNLIPGTRDHNYAACINTWYWWMNFIQDQEYLKTLFDFNLHVSNSLSAVELDENIIINTDPQWLSKYKTEIPLWLYFVGNYDIWNWHGSKLWNEFIIPFEYCLRSEIDGPSGAYELIKNYFDCITYRMIPDYSSYIKTGKRIFRYQEKRNNSVLGNLYKKVVLNETTGQNVNCVIINTQDRGSVIFDNISPELRLWTDYFILWNYTGKKYKYSAYSDKDHILVPELKIKGFLFGGHPHAGGVVSDKKLL